MDGDANGHGHHGQGFRRQLAVAGEHRWWRLELTDPVAMLGEGRRPLTIRTLLPLALASVGGPLALAALYAPGAVEDVTSAGGLASLAAAVVFLAPLAIWLRYSRDVVGPGGLYAFVAAAAGRRVALVQAVAWVASYTLYLLYTSAYVVYDLLPVPWPGVHRWRALLVVLLPVGIAAVALAGRLVMFGVIGVIGVGQVVLMVVLDVVAVRHAPGAAAFRATGGGDTVHATASMATLFVCGSLPLFLGGEVASARRAFRRVLPVAFAIAVVGIVLAVYPLARDPAFTRAAIPGLSLAAADAGHATGVAIGAGVAASVVGVMLLEYAALTRLLYAVSGVQVVTWIRILAAGLLVAAPLSLAIGPERFYDKLLQPSLALLWVAQAIVVTVFPLFIAGNGSKLRAWHVLAAAVALAVCVFGFVSAVQGGGGT